ncbi:ribokinase isoform X2 [Nymphaea colorata]|uniref:ribokinase isoform X2 n=1 Tax=Nymphaea colorata TaxID=210225 RepID=UPI00129DB5F9|nr:ribokinase isoform X2 [Nymphaea colorata]
MEGLIGTISPPQQWDPTRPTATRPHTTRISIPIHLHLYTNRNSRSRSLSFRRRLNNPSKVAATIISSSLGEDQSPPLVVVGSANADIYVEIDRLPREGETVSAKTGQTLAGGKGANQAVCGGKLSHPTFFIGQLGSDAHARLIAESLGNGGVHLDRVSRNEDAPTGHAVVMLQPDGQNSIIIVGGANMCCWPDQLPAEDVDVIEKAGVVLLQREIPDRVNIQVAKVARAAKVPVILDAGGMDGPLPAELLKLVDILSPNESELGRLTGLPTDSFDQISQAATACHQMGVNQVLVKLGEKGSALFIEGKEPIKQAIIPASKVVDTTGAGDTFTAAFAVALVEGKSHAECMKFAAAAASLCVQVKGAIPSMPERTAVLELLKSL